MRHIISASRRTDLPRFYPEWLINRVRAGYCVTANPHNPRQISRVDLTPETVAVLVLWTRDARPLAPHLPVLDELGLRYYVQHTLTNYPPELEPRMPPLADRVASFLGLADKLGPDRVIWRYDPIVLSQVTDIDFHRREFDCILRKLAGQTARVFVSLADTYPWMARRLRSLDGTPFAVSAISEMSRLSTLLSHISEASASHHIEALTCAEPMDPQPCGLRAGKCIDDAYIARVFGIAVSSNKDLGQRAECGCVQSRDIGVYDTCIAGCLYCYATRHLEVARLNLARHDPRSPSLVGWRDAPHEPPAQLPLWDDPRPPSRTQQ